jgi:uncharacterized protein YigA (DUF484 family)
MSPVTQAAAEDTNPTAQDGNPAAADARPAGSDAGPAAPDVAGTPGAAPDGMPAAAGAEAGSGAAASLDDELVADWLHANPGFFDRHADLLSDVRLRHPHGGRAISLVERQVLVLRERNKALEIKMAELIRIGQENDAIGQRLQQLTEDLLQASDPAGLPALLTAGLADGFGVPQVAIRLWGIAGLEAPYGGEASSELRRRTDELAKPYCGPNSFPEVAAWLPGGGEQTASMALLPLRRGEPGSGAFGLVVLGSDDAARFQAGMGTAFLERIAEIAAASLSRLLS